MRRLLYVVMFITLFSTILFHPGTTMAESNHTHEPTIEKQNAKKSSSKPHPKFTWGSPRPISPVLHPGSVRGAGMIQEPLLNIGPVMENMIASGAFPGAVTFVAKGGHIVQHEAYGHAYLYEDDNFTEAENQIPMRKDTIFDLASISKIFTTTATMKLYEDGHFELDDPVAMHLPEFATNGKEDVTISQLMTHTSGFPPSAPVYDVEGDREARHQYVLQYPLSNEPGTVYTYSDLNMITLGILIERLSGQRLDHYVKENITEPLNMNDTMYNPPESLQYRIAATEYMPWTDRGIVWGQVHDEKAWALDGIAGHAGVFSTAHDLAILAHMYLNKGSYGGKQILKPETVDLLVENQIPEFPGDDHGLGWEMSQMWYMEGLSEASSLGHTGYTGTSIVINQNNDTIAILLTNRVHPTRNTVSTNPARRKFTELVADAIPVSMPNKKEGAWFAGYGDLLNRTLIAEVNLETDATLSFDTWFRTEQDYDLGIVEISSDGENWTKILDPFTGTSVDWLSQEVVIPSETSHIRFRYETDTYYHGRGWYIANLEVKDSDNVEIPLDLISDGWTKRNY